MRDDGLAASDAPAIPTQGLASADLQPLLPCADPFRLPGSVAAGQALLPHRGNLLRRGVSAKDEGYYYDTA